MLAGMVLYRGWQEVMARPCQTVWSPNKQFKVEYYVYGYVPGWYDYIHGMSDSFDWPGFIRITDKDGRTIERRDEDGMGLHCNVCIGIQAQLTKPSRALLEIYGCKGDEKPDESIGSLLGGGHVLWEGRLRDGKEKWYVMWRNWYNGSADNIDVTTYLPGPPLDECIKIPSSVRTCSDYEGLHNPEE